MKKLIFLLIPIVFCSCSMIHKAEKVQTLEANNLLESYYETIWNPENNLPGEKKQAKKEIKIYLKTLKK